MKERELNAGDAVHGLKFSAMGTERPVDGVMRPSSGFVLVSVSEWDEHHMSLGIGKEVEDEPELEALLGPSEALALAAVLKRWARGMLRRHAALQEIDDRKRTDDKT